MEGREGVIERRFDRMKAPIDRRAALALLAGGTVGCSAALAATPSMVLDGPAVASEHLGSGGGIAHVEHPAFGSDADPWSTRIQRAIDSVHETGGGIAQCGGRRYPITSPAILRSGVTLNGVGPGLWPAAMGIHGTTLEAAADLEAVIMTDGEESIQPASVQNLLVYGGSHAVGTGIKLRGRSISLVGVHVIRCPSVGVHWLPLNGSGLPSWVNWMERCNVTQNGGVSMIVECTDSFFNCNYFRATICRAPGGNTWTSNHFDNAGPGQAGLRMETAPGDPTVQGQVTGNYFDANTIGFSFGPGPGAPPRARWAVAFGANSFRANIQDIEITDTDAINIQGSVHRGGSTTRRGIVLSGCNGGSLGGVTWLEAEYPDGFLSGVPANMQLTGVGGT